MITLRRTAFYKTISCCLLLLSSCAPAPYSRHADLRVVRVKAVADEALREENPRWRETLDGLLNAASDYFEDNFGIRLDVQEIAAWSPAGRSPFTSVLLRQLKETYPPGPDTGNADLVIGFTGSKVDTYGMGIARVDRIGDCQHGLGTYVISSAGAPFRYKGKQSELEWDAVALVHEMGHVFGATHTPESDSIMHYPFGYRSRFDLKNSDVISRNKFCAFGRGEQARR